MPLVMAYLTTVVLPNREKGVGLRNERELRTLAKAIDLVLEGQLLSALDLLAQRFKAVETVTTGATWSEAKYHQLIPTDKVTCVDPR